MGPWFWIIFSSRFLHTVCVHYKSDWIDSFVEDKVRPCPVHINSKLLPNDSRCLLGRRGMDCCGLLCQQTYSIWFDAIDMQSIHPIIDCMTSQKQYCHVAIIKTKRMSSRCIYRCCGNFSLHCLFQNIVYIFYQREGNLFSVLLHLFSCYSLGSSGRIWKTHSLWRSLWVYELR